MDLASSSSMAFLGVIIVAALPREDEEDVRREEKTREDVVVGAIVVAKEQAANMVLRCFLFLDIMERICFFCKSKWSSLQSVFGKRKKFRAEENQSPARSTERLSVKILDFT